MTGYRQMFRRATSLPAPIELPAEVPHGQDR